MTKKLLECIGIDPARVRLEWISASEGPQFAQVVRDLVEQVKGVGPSPLGRKYSRIFTSQEIPLNSPSRLPAPRSLGSYNAGTDGNGGQV